MNDFSHQRQSEIVEVDPTGRYGRYNEILGKEASKTVYRGLDTYEGIEVAWNQVKLSVSLQNAEDLERFNNEILLLKTLTHDNVMKFYSSWVDTANRTLNFATEILTSNLRQYRSRHKIDSIRAVKHWCRQILRGLDFLHSHDPPVIHGNIKCDNIFINAARGHVKIGDFCSALFLRKSHPVHFAGTPEFTATEVYEGVYNELVDIYSFGMCILEMATSVYPFKECNDLANIHKKAISGKKPDALYKVKDPELRQFVEKCLPSSSLRLSARELLNDPFLQNDNSESERPLDDHSREVDGSGTPIRQHGLELHDNTNPYVNEYSYGYCYDSDDDYCENLLKLEEEKKKKKRRENVGTSVTGKKTDEDGISLRLRIANKEGCTRNIYFPFDVETDTALSVATEMVAELFITDEEATKIAGMIDVEISSLVPEWRPGPGTEETPVSPRLCASKMLTDPSLQNDDSESDMRQLNYSSCEVQSEQKHHQVEIEHSANVDMSIKAKTREDGSIFLMLQITDKKGRIRKTYFPFDVETDTALDIATDMVAEPDSADQDVNNIADMIEAEISSLAPEWRPKSTLYLEPQTPGITRESVQNNVMGSKPSVRLDLVRKEAISFLGNKPTIYGVPLV